MSEAQVHDVAPLQSYRRGLFAATAGCAMVSTVLLLAALVILFKPQFGRLVGPWFLPGMSAMVLAGGLAMLWGAWKLRGRGGWEWLALFVWGAVALTSPA